MVGTKQFAARCSLVLATLDGEQLRPDSARSRTKLCAVDTNAHGRIIPVGAMLRPYLRHRMRGMPALLLGLLRFDRHTGGGPRAEPAQECRDVRDSVVFHQERRTGALLFGPSRTVRDDLLVSR